MISVTSLAVPILVAAVLVFIVSALLHMVIAAWHEGDLDRLPDEEGVMNALRPFTLRPGNYAMPKASGMADMKSPAFVDKMTRGPVAFLTVGPSGPPAMGKELALWFAYCVLVGVLAAAVAAPLLHPGEGFHEVLHTTGLVAFAAYGLGLMQESIWWRRKWSATIKSMIDGLIYATITGAVFGWLWPA